MFQVEGGRLPLKLPPKLPKPKTSSLPRASEVAIINSCITVAQKGFKPTDSAVKTFNACHQDYWGRSASKPATGDLLKSLNQCTRPGGFKSQSTVYKKYEKCVLRRAGR